MVTCIKSCCWLGYACRSAGIVKDQIEGCRLIEGREITDGPLKAHVKRIAEQVGFKSVSLIELPQKGVVPNRDCLYSLSFSKKHGFCQSSPMKIIYRAGHTFSTEAMRFFLTRQIIEIKTRSLFFKKLLPLITSIAVTILLHPFLPIASYFIGFFMGRSIAVLSYSLVEGKIDQLLLRHSTLAERRAAMDAYVDLQKQELDACDGTQEDLFLTRVCNASKLLWMALDLEQKVVRLRNLMF